MGWKGDRCWYCKADLASLMALDGLPDEWQQMVAAEFDRHMSSDCVNDPQTQFEQEAAESFAAEFGADGMWHG